MLEVRIVIRPGPGDKKEIMLYDPRSGREVRTNNFVHPRDLDREVRRVKEDMERKGFQVTVKEL
jgi:hypothetical protein